MIVFDLRCANAHVFEAWFRSSNDFEDQRGRQLIACPVCNDSAVAKAVMAPRVGAKGNSRTDQAPVPVAGGGNADAASALAALAALQAKLLEKSSWVGSDFADRARAMHLGEEPSAQIHGQASRDEVKSLVEDGVPVVPLLVPVVPPDLVN